MSGGGNIKNRLVDVNDSVLIIIDIQDSFLNRYDNAVSQSVLTKSVWLIEIAKFLGVPIIAMAEDIGDVGHLNQSIHDALPEETVIYNKDCFNLADNPEILVGVDDTGRKTAVLVGMETDICVAQSALGLIENNYQVVALRDAIATTAVNEEAGISRMREAGVVISSVRALYYEWQRSVTNCKKLRAQAPELQVTKGQTA
jgi:nicotinamidase-related amidase